MFEKKKRNERMYIMEFLSLKIRIRNFVVLYGFILFFFSLLPTFLIVIVVIFIAMYAWSRRFSTESTLKLSRFPLVFSLFSYLT